MEIGYMNKNWLAELAADGAGAIAASVEPQPAESCAENLIKR